jgi:translation initiation factor 2 beta subunit (eIF-2beta)/eIF-5
VQSSGIVSKKEEQRRIEPSERIRELGGASVPFGFDVHALIFSKDAPDLESRFHKRFRANQLNLANERKEFFKVSLDEIEQFARDNEFAIEFTRVAEARNYRETLALRAKMSDSEIESELDRNFPQTLFGDTVEAEPL